MQKWRAAMRLENEAIALSSEDSEALANYFKANWLLLRCAKAAFLVTPAIWQQITNRMLRPLVLSPQSLQASPPSDSTSHLGKTIRDIHTYGPGSMHGDRYEQTGYFGIGANAGTVRERACSSPWQRPRGRMR